MAILSTELFKLRLLFHLKGVNHDVSKFVTTIRANAPATWPLLEPYVDGAFRNALAHGTYAIRGKKVVLFADAKLLPSSDKNPEMTLDQFMFRVKECNVLYACLTSVLDDLTTKSFFK
jgi:hypothetical protein